MTKAATRKPPSASKAARAVLIPLEEREDFDARVKALLAHIHHDSSWARVQPPLAPFAAADRAAVVAGYDGVRAAK